MHFSSSLISSLLLAPVVLAERPREFRRSPLDLVGKRTNAVSDVETDSTWAGASWIQDEGTFSMVSGTITIPELSGQTDSTRIGAALVGIDNSLNVCNSTGGFMAGVTFQHNPTGPIYSAWYQWQPDAVQAIPDTIGTFSPGDVVEITVMTLLLSNTFGFAIIKNHSKNLTSIQDVQSDHALCLESAEWIVQANEAAPLPNFDTIAFENAVAGGYGEDYHPLGATIYNIIANGRNLTSVHVDENSVTVKYTGT